jgi:hypothetical protein
VIPSLLYTWQYYDLVDTVANPSRSCFAFWLRAIFVSCASFGTIVATFLYSLCVSFLAWYLQPKNFNKSLIAHFTTLYPLLDKIIFYFTALCCLLSIGFLGGTIYWVITLTKKQNQNKL